MARARNIKPSIMDNEELAELEPLTRLLFIYLWMLADREGRLEDRPKRIAAQALAYDRNADVGAMLDSLHKAGFILRYEAKGVACIQIVAFAKHQAPHIREAASELPAHDPAPAKAVPKHDLGSAEASPRSPDSGFSDSGFSDSGLGTARAGLATPTGKKAKQTPMPDDFAVSDRVRLWADAKGYGHLDEHLEGFRRKVAAHGYTAASWDDKFMQAIREDWAKVRGRTANGAAPPPDVQKPRGIDPELERLNRQRAQATPIPPEIRAALGKIRSGHGATPTMSTEAASCS